MYYLKIHRAKTTLKTSVVKHPLARHPACIHHLLQISLQFDTLLHMSLSSTMLHNQTAPRVAARKVRAFSVISLISISRTSSSKDIVDLRLHSEYPDLSPVACIRYVCGARMAMVTYRIPARNSTEAYNNDLARVSWLTL